jgi:SpoIIAA-like
LITVLDGYPDEVLAISATGHVTAEDYHQILIPEAEARFRRNGKMRILFQIGEAFEGVSPGAILADARFAVGHVSKLRRMAIVTDVGWIVHSAHLFGPFFHVPLRVFPNAAFDAARAWILEGKTA